MRLRPATAADSARVLAWRNDSDSVAASLTGAAVAPDEHAAWFGRRMGDIRIAEDDGEPVGQVRLDPDGELSIAVAPEARGRGYASRMIEAAVALAPGPLVTARVKEDNARSLRAFARAGFAETRREGGVVHLERACTSG